MKGIPMLILLNKSDIPSYMGADNISDKLQLFNLKCNDYLMLPCSALTGEGLQSAINWIIDAVTNRNLSKDWNDNL